MSSPENPPAFPPQAGMSLRDYLAAHALTGLIGAYIHGNGACMGAEHFVRNIPKHAYALADATLTERSK